MIEHCNRNDPGVASWINDGHEFMLGDQVALETKYIPLFYMNRTKFSSFIRQLNMYGFRKTSDISSPGSKTSEDTCGQNVVYRHDSFQEGRPDLLDGVQRSKTGDHSHRKQRESEALKNTTASLATRISCIEDKVAALDEKMDQIVRKLDNLFDVVSNGNCATCSCAKSSTAKYSSKRPKRDASVLKNYPANSPVNGTQHKTIFLPDAPQLPQNQSNTSVARTDHKTQDKEDLGDTKYVPRASLTSPPDSKLQNAKIQEDDITLNGFFYDFFSLKGCNVFPEDKHPAKHEKMPCFDTSQQREKITIEETRNRDKISSRGPIVGQEKDPEAGKSNSSCTAMIDGDDLETLPDIDFASLDGMNEEKDIMIPLYRQEKPLGGFMRHHQRVALSTAFIMIAVALSLGFARPHVRHGQAPHNNFPSASPSLQMRSLQSLVPSAQPTQNFLPTSIIVPPLPQIRPAQDARLTTNRVLLSKETKNARTKDNVVLVTESVHGNDENVEKVGWITV